MFGNHIKYRAARDYLDVLWGVMGCYGVLWDHVGSYGIIWDHMGSYGIIWDQATRLRAWKAAEHSPNFLSKAGAVGSQEKGYT